MPKASHVNSKIYIADTTTAKRSNVIHKGCLRLKEIDLLKRHGLYPGHFNIVILKGAFFFL